MFFILDKDLQSVGVIKEYWEDLYTEALEDNFATLDFSTTANANLKEENFIVYPDTKTGKHQLFVIKKIKDNGQTFEVESELAATGELLDAWVLPTTTLNSYSMEDAMNYILTNADWEAGSVDFVGVADFEWDSFITVKEALNELTERFNVELEYEVEFNGTQVERKLIHVHQRRGADTGLPLEVSKDISEIHREVDTTDLITAVYVRGKDDLNLAGFTPKTHTDRFSNKGSHVIDEEAYQLWNNNSRQKFGFFESEATDKTELWEQTVAYLKENSTPKYVYEVDVAFLEQLEDLNLGDSINIKDFYHRKEEPLILNARVVKIERSKANTKLVLGDYKAVKFAPPVNLGKIQEEIRKNEEKLEELELNSIYTGPTPPDGPQVNQLWLDTTTDPNMLKRWTGAEWLKIADDGKKALEALGLIEATQEEIVSVIERFDNLDSTNVITPVEKTLLLRQWKTIQNTYAIKRAEAVLYSISVVNLDTAYNNLSSALGPILADTLVNSEANFEDITNLLSAYNGMEVRIQDTINFVLNQNIGSVKSTAETVRDRFNAFDEQYALSQNILDQTIDDLETEIGEAQGSIGTITGQIGTINTNIGTIDGKITGINTNLGTVNTDVGTLKTSVGTINTNIGTINGKITGINTNIGTINSNIDTIDGKITGINTDLSTMTTRFTDIDSAIESVEDGLGSLTTRIGTAETGLTTITTSVDGIATRITDAEGDISEVVQTASGLATRIGTAESGISTLTQTAAGLRTDVNKKVATTTYNTYVTQTATALGAKAEKTYVDTETGKLASSLSTLTQTAEGLETRVEDTEAGISTLTQTASGLRTDVNKKVDSSIYNTYVSQTATALQSKAEKTYVDTETGKLTNSLSTLTQTAEGIESRVEDAEDGLSTLTQTAAGLRTDVNKKVDTTTYNSYVSQTATALQSKLSSTDAASTYATQSSLTQTAEGIQTTVSEIDGRLGSAESTITQQAGLINSKVNQTDFTSAMGTKEDGIVKASVAPAHALDKLWLDTSKTPYILKRSTGTTWVNASPTTASQVGAFSTTQGTALTNRVSTAETNITQANDAIQLKAEKTYVDTITGEIASDLSTLTVAVDGIEGRVEDAEGNLSTLTQTASGLATRVSTAEGNLSTLTQTAEGLRTDVNKKVDTSTYNSYVSQTATALQSKLSATDAASTYATKSLLTQTAEGIESTVSGINTRLGSAESTITQQAGLINAKVSQTDFTTELGKKEDGIVKATTAPAHANGKLWLDTSKTPNILNRSTGTAWVKITPTTAAEVGAYSSTQGSTLAGRVSTTETNITQANNAIALKAEKTYVDTQTGLISADLSQLTVAVDGIETRVEDTEGSISTLTQTASGLATRVGNAEGSLSTLTQTAAGLRTDVNKKVDTTTYNSYVSQTATALQSKISTIDADAKFATITSLTQTSDALQLKAEKDYVDDVASDLSTLTLSFNGIETQVSNVAGDVSTLTQTANSLGTRLTDSEGKVSTLTQTVNGINTRVGTAEGNISAFNQTMLGFQTRVEDAEGNISTLNQTVGSHGTQITAVDGKASEALQTANGIKTVVEDPETGLSAILQTAAGIQSQVSETVQSTTEQLDSLSAAVDSKAGLEELGLVSADLAATQASLAVETERISTVEQTASGIKTTVGTLQTVVNDGAETISNVESYMEFTEDGLKIGKSDSDMNVNITNTDIEFLDNGQKVAYINGQKYFITQGEITESLIVGNHKFEKGATSTTITWIG